MRKTISGLVVAGLTLVCLAGCNTLARQPQLKDVAITPAELKANDRGAVTVRVVDRHHIVKRLEGTIKEEPKVKLKFRDDGVDEDKAAGDGIWTYRFRVDPAYPAGQYNLLITAYRSDGQPVSVKREDKTKGPLTVTVPLVVKGP